MDLAPGSGSTAGSATTPSPPTAKRNSSTSATHGSGLLSKLSFMRTSTPEHRSSRHGDENGAATPITLARENVPSTALQHEQQQQRTRRRRGSLRKVALLGRGAQRERRESSRSAGIDNKQTAFPLLALDDVTDPGRGLTERPTMDENDSYGLGISDITPRPSMDGYASRSATANSTPSSTASSPGMPIGVPSKLTTPPITIPSSRHSAETDPLVTSPTVSYSTTDDEDALHIGGSGSSGAAASAAAALLRPERASLSSGSESYFAAGGGGGGGVGPGLPSGIQSLQRRRSIQRAKSPLALTGLTGGGGLAAAPLGAVGAVGAADAEWDYSETEWWGWVVLVVTWLVFVTGMGSCLGLWSWAWDVGTTPYAPPELEDDPTLPIVGYYPALIILSCVMAWVWVVVAWVGMKYFRHARVSGD